MSRNFRAFRSRALAGIVMTVIVVVASIAQAAGGSLKFRNTDLTEVSGGWHAYVDIGLPKAPSLPHVPMKFLFTKLVVYERALVDNHPEPVLNRQPLVNQTPTVEDQDVDFADPSGKVFSRTRFDFSLTRTRGYEAGEYKVQLRTAEGVEIGGTVTLTLKGDNPVVDRRSITFNAKEGGMKKVDNGLDGGQVAKNEFEDTNPTASNEVIASGAASPFIPPEAFNKTPEEEVKTHPAGCGCSIPGFGDTASALWMAAPLAGILVAISRRKRRRG